MPSLTLIEGTDHLQGNFRLVEMFLDVQQGQPCLELVNNSAFLSDQFRGWKLNNLTRDVLDHVIELKAMDD